MSTTDLAAGEAEILEAKKAEGHDDNTMTMTCGDDVTTTMKPKTLEALEATGDNDVTTMTVQCGGGTITLQVAYSRQGRLRRSTRQIKLPKEDGRPGWR